jgi:hypothetical protein
MARDAQEAERLFEEALQKHDHRVQPYDRSPTVISAVQCDGRSCSEWCSRISRRWRGFRPVVGRQELAARVRLGPSATLERRGGWRSEA